MVIVDSTVWIDYLNDVETPETRWLDARLDQERLGILDLMLCEVLQGLPSDAQARLVLEHMRRFEMLDSGGTALAIAAAASAEVRTRTTSKSIRSCQLAVHFRRSASAHTEPPINSSPDQGVRRFEPGYPRGSR